jgi:hypothetical protein
MFSQKYNLENTTIIGNPFAENIESNPYKEEIIANKILSPYLSSPVVIKGKKQKTYPSLIQYLWALRLCYGDAIKQLLEKTPTEAEEVFDKYRKKCELVFDKYKESYNISTLGKSLQKKKKEPKEKLSGQFPVAKIEYESVKDFIVKRTDTALNIIYDIAKTKNNFSEKLISTRDKKIIFFDKDDILGVGSNGKGLNLFGKKLMEVRSQLISRETRESIISPFIKNIETIKVSDINSTKLSSIENWIAKKIQLVSRITGSFFDYLTKPRQDYMPVKPAPVIVSPYEGVSILVITNDEYFNKMFTEDVKDKTKMYGTRVTNFDYNGTIVSGWKTSRTNLAELRLLIQSRELVSPVITNTMVKYVLSQILHCNILNTFDKVIFPAITPDIENTITELVKNEITDQDLRLSTTVSSIACKDIWMYVCTMTEYMMLQIFSKDYTLENASPEEVNSRFSQILENIEFNIVSNKRDFVDHGFNTDEENAVAQYFLYMCCALTDWLDLDSVSTNEFKFCEKILLFKDNTKFDIKIETCPNLEDYKNLLTKMFYNKGLIVFDKDLTSLSNFIYSVSKNMSSRASDHFITNRVYFYANII